MLASYKYVGITSAANGKLYCAPSNATQVLEIDPSYWNYNFNRKCVCWHIKYAGIASAANGKLYCAPRDATQVLEIDPVTGTTALIGSVYADK
jgi:hypothetical protein